MPCNCGNFHIVPPAPKKCDDCLVVNSLRLACDDGPDPCGDTITIDLTEYNDVTACDCGTPVYSLVSYHEEAFEDVEVTSDGQLTATTGEWYVYDDYPVIRYKVDCPCNILSASGNVYVCFKNPCPTECYNNCVACTGECLPEDLDVIVDGGGVIGDTVVDGDEFDGILT